MILLILMYSLSGVGWYFVVDFPFFIKFSETVFQDKVLILTFQEISSALSGPGRTSTQHSLF